MAGGTIVRGTTTAVRRTAGPDKPIRSFKSKGRHLFFKIFFFTVGAANGFGGSENDGLKILTAVQTGIFINRHEFILPIFSKIISTFSAFSIVPAVFGPTFQEGRSQERNHQFMTADQIIPLSPFDGGAMDYVGGRAVMA